MGAASLPHDEATRQQALDALNVLDTLPESFSDAVATAAAAIANVPISAISLVDGERQWFKSECGLGTSETPRDISFCAHAILGTEPFLIEDTFLDERFRENPLVTGAPFIRSYQGFPIVVGGQAVGSLCVIDDRPRRLDPEQIEKLTRLAAGTATWLHERESMTRSLSRAEAELRHVTLTDATTGLPNRLVFQDRLRHAARRCDEAGGALTVVCVDLDRFRTVAESLGEAGAAEVLRETARRLGAVAGPARTVAAVGGDQFLVLDETADDAAAIEELAARLARAVGAPVASARGLVSLTASLGVARYPTDGVVERLVGMADAAMVTAKQAGGDACRFFDSALDEEARERSRLIDALRGAGARRELRLLYQPKIEARSGQITGVEALLRWQHAEHGHVSPAVFVPLAEGAGLIGEIGAWVIDDACRQMREWCDAGFHMRVAINLSMHQLRAPGLADAIAAALARHGVEPGLLTCEVTESVAMGGAAPVVRALESLGALGVRLSIDDFGTGYSSLSYLRKMPIHQLKIDRSFVTDVAESEDARLVVAAIVDLAHALRLEVVAEGVETEAQRELLVGMGCDKLQGYLFARPMAARDLTRWANGGDRERQEFRPSVFALT